jgi:hypothetical protein
LWYNGLAVKQIPFATGRCDFLPPLYPNVVPARKFHPGVLFSLARSYRGGTSPENISHSDGQAIFKVHLLNASTL